MSDPLRRVVIALDSSHDSLHSFDEAAEMAARIGAELVGVFVEDTNLLKLAGLPCASEVGSATGRSRSLNPLVVGRTLKGIAERAKVALGRAADHRKVRWSFTTTRGSLFGQLLEAAEQEGSRGTPRPRGGRRAVASPARSILLLHMGPCIRPEGAAVILVSASYASLQVLPTALALADQSCTRRTLILIIADSPLDARRQRDRVAAVLATDKQEAEIRALPPLDVDALRSFLSNVHCGALILDGGASLIAPDGFNALVENSDFPVFVLR